jgi:uncharacterized protein
MRLLCYDVRVNPIDVSVYRSDSPAATLILAHGAGAGRHSRFMVEAGRELARRQITTVTFDFPYIAAGRKVPDKAPVLEAHWEAVIAQVRRNADERLPLAIGGKSMGGRMASHVAARGVEGVRGLVFLGYPLHPPGRPDQRRDGHLPAIRLPMLFVQGSRDEFGTAAEIRALLPSLTSTAKLFEVEGGDHSFKTPARSGRSASDVLGQVFDAVAAFVKNL